MKKIFLAILLINFLCFIPELTLADGMVFRFGDKDYEWDYSDEKDQQAIINYENGTEKMILSIDTQTTSDKNAVWVFPVPADPDKIVLNVIEEIPKLSGEEIASKIDESLFITKRSFEASQIYPIPYSIFKLFPKSHSNSGPFGMPGSSLSASFGSSEYEQDVNVYAHVQKEGISSEVITAKTANGLFDYLKSKGLNIQSGSIPVLDSYIGKDFSFVVSWLASPISEQYVKKVIQDNYNTYYYDHNKNFILLINDLINQKYLFEFPGVWDIAKEKDMFSLSDVADNVADNIDSFMETQKGQDFLKEITQTIKNDPAIIDFAFKKGRKGIYLTFPTEDIYFPLLPTSVYRDRVVPASIRIIGHVSPKLFQNIKNYTTVKYYIDPSFYQEDLKNFYKGGEDDVKYTKIEINAPSKFLTEDLWISDKMPVKIKFLNFVYTYPIVIGIIFFILSSVMAGILAGLIVFRNLKNSAIKFGLIGLFNCFTVLGVIAATWLTKTKDSFESVRTLLGTKKWLGYFIKKIIVIISLLFVAIPLFLLLLPWLGFAIFADELKFVHELNLMKIPGVIFAISVIFIVVFRTIKSEDKELFAQLKNSGYSTLSLTPRDKRKIIFVLLFSALFLLISWLMCIFIELLLLK